MAEVRRVSEEKAVRAVRRLEIGAAGKAKPKAKAWPVRSLVAASTAGVLVIRLLTRQSKNPAARFVRGLSYVEALTAWTYAYAIRPWQLRWGATDDEVKQFLPGDELVSDPQYETTHAITINAPADKVWPWLIQMGQGRGGMYSYDWLENLAGLDIHSADHIIPELQNLKVGDTVPLAPGGFGPAVQYIDPNRALVLGGAFNPYTGETVDMSRLEPGAYWNTGWAFVLDELTDATTRLIVRFRADYEPRLRHGLTVHLPLEPIHFIMERKMLLGIKKRAERTI